MSNFPFVERIRNRLDTAPTSIGPIRVQAGHARRFIAEGARTAIAGTNPDGIARAQDILGRDALVLRADAGDVAGQAAIARAVGQAFGRLDIVFINAGVADFRPIEAWDEAGFDRSVAVNLKGPFFLVQALLPILATPSSIILTASINARIGMPNSSVYAATKAGLISMARTLSGELIGRGIRVNAVSPGPVSTPIYGKLGLPNDQADAMANAIRGQVPLGRFGAASEIADAVVFLAADESAFTVGSEFIIDGGMSNL